MDVNVLRVMNALKQRSDAGQLKYGTTTERTDLSLRDWLQHLQEELLDAAVYVERLKSEPGEEAESPGVRLIADERRRQVEVEEWDAGHDDAQRSGAMRRAAACYAAFAGQHRAAPPEWPWGFGSWKPKDEIRDLVRAGALIAAEIDRLKRQEREGE